MSLCMSSDDIPNGHWTRMWPSESTTDMSAVWATSISPYAFWVTSYAAPKAVAAALSSV